METFEFFFQEKMENVHISQALCSRSQAEMSQCKYGSDRPRAVL